MDPNLKNARIFKREAIEAVDLLATALGNAAADVPTLRAELMALKQKAKEIETTLACMQIPNPSAGSTR